MTLQKKIIDHLKAEGAWVVKVEVANERGCPDILACIDGRFVGIEVKERPSDWASPIQQAQLHLIRQAGGVGIIVRDFDAFKKHLNNLKGDVCH